MKTRKTTTSYRFTKNYPRPYKCLQKDCKWAYEHPNAFLTHMKVVHGVNNCGICKKTFKSTIAFSKHKSLHGKPKYKCEICEKKFYSYGSKFNCNNSHNKLFECEVCKGRFVQKSGLYRHSKNFKGFCNMKKSNINF